MKRKKKQIIFICFFVTAIIIGIFIYHRVLLNKELPFMEPLGKMVSVNDHKISIYKEGGGSKTLVFLSGSGTCSPILDFKSLFSRLSDDYKIVVVERAGYGFSPSVNTRRDIKSVLEDTRNALIVAGIEGPYILCPHSMAGIEAIYWTQEYPKEVEGVIGLDMATPYHYENMRIKKMMLYFSKFMIHMGGARLLPNIWKGDAVKHGTLSDKEKEIYHALFFRKSLSRPMVSEVRFIKDGAAFVQSRGLPQIPLLMFVSNGENTGMKKDLWIKCSENFINQVQNGEMIKLDCPHYVHDYLYDEISENMKIFIGAL